MADEETGRHLVEFVPSRKRYKAQSWISAYHGWVIERLIGVHGTTSSDVVSWIISIWINENREYLEKLGLGTPRVSGPKLVVTSDE